MRRTSGNARLLAWLPLTGAATLAALLLLRSEEGGPALVTVLVLGAIALSACVSTAGQNERTLVAGIFLVAMTSRTVAATLIRYWNPVFFSFDQGEYFRYGCELATQWRQEGGGPSLVWLISGPGNHFHEMWAVLSYYVGPSQLALRCATGVVGAYTAVRVYALAKEAFGESAGPWAGWLAACWPSFIVWSAQGLRDPLLIWLWCEVGLGVVRIHRGRGARGLTGLALALYGLTLLRPYAAVLAALGVCLALLAAAGRRAQGAKLLGIGVAGLALLVGGLGFLGSDYLAGKDVETAADIHRSFWGGGSSFAIGIDISRPLVAAVYLPLGLAYFLLAPFPWQTGSALQMSTMIEQPVWYVVFAFGLSGAVWAARRRGADGLALLAVGLPAILFYGLVMSNIGTGYRDKAQVVPYVFAYAAQGLLTWRARHAKRRRQASGDTRFRPALSGSVSLPSIVPRDRL